jgi:hypothetical protein
VDKTKNVEVVNNEFSINAIKVGKSITFSYNYPFKYARFVQVILAKDGSHLFISCNRLLGLPVSPECVTTTTTSTTTTPTTQRILSADRKGNSPGFIHCTKISRQLFTKIWELPQPTSVKILKNES